MNKIKSFNHYKKNEEWGAMPSATRGEGGGVRWMDNLFEIIGDKLGMEVDILSRYIKSKMNDEFNPLDPKKAEEISKHLLTRVGGKSRDEIYMMVDQLTSDFS
jgi:hypothetical protein